MILAVELLGALSWSPGFKGLLTVAVAVAILCGSIALILSTNAGARLGFLLALTGLFGWFVVMGSIWSIYGIGYKGPAPSWNVVNTVVGPPSHSAVPKADSLPLPEDLPDPTELRNADPKLVEEFPKEAPRQPNLGDLAGVSPEIKEQVNEQISPWKILETSSKYTGETQSAVSEALGPDHEALFETAADYMVIDSFVTGGKKGRSDNSIIGRVAYKVTSAFSFKNDPFLAAVQLQAVVPQETQIGQAPPPPVRDEDAQIITVVLERDRGALRLPSISFTIFSTIVFGVLASMLHRRDKLAMEQRSAPHVTVG